MRDNDDYENHISFPEDRGRIGIRNFTWTVTAIKDWEDYLEYPVEARI
jgi:hypothetical protein